MFLDRVINLFTSLRLTVVCLACALVLVFFGTLAQVTLGLYATQEVYFRSLFVFWSPEGSNWRIPIWPGGWLLGGLLLVNLIAAHIKRFKFTWKKSGIFLIHGGLILLLLGQFLTEVFQVESAMRLEEGETKNYSESFRDNELVLVNTSKPDLNEVISIPEPFLEKSGVIRDDKLPVTIRVKDYWPNSLLDSEPFTAVVARNGASYIGTIRNETADALVLVPESGMPVRLAKDAIQHRQEAARVEATQGFGRNVYFLPLKVTAEMDKRNLPSALLELETPQGSLGTWLVASQTRARQSFELDGQTYELALRFKRHYKPYYIQLVDFTHDRYKGTEIPKNFSSRIRLMNPGTREDREMLIYMNNPLRYGGETYYQGGFEPGDAVSILQVVRNPAWLTPYLSCTLVGAGLLVHFLMHLFAFAKKSFPRGAGRGLPVRKSPAKRPKPEPVPALVTAGATAEGLRAVERKSA